MSPTENDPRQEAARDCLRTTIRRVLGELPIVSTRHGVDRVSIAHALVRAIEARHMKPVLAELSRDE